ncbi:hypothetical protein MTR67_048901 [Solanum verrucosum]|uniref:Uncharacterized protein n=1 Tax=Solanum verrucosum TaxID=315347 RepID=A0AAF0ZXU9_SOLVR|nr:hypothetical protein MTR67_048901 [Solanum verrucosum]
MLEFSSWIEELELKDPTSMGRSYTCFRGINHQTAARLDSFLYSMEWEENFKSIRLRILPRVASDQCPIILECEHWEQRQPYFKFENWWLKVEGFKDMVQDW